MFKKLIASSANPEKVSLTVKSMAVGVIPFLVMISAYTAVDLSAVELNALLESILSFINAVLGVVATAGVVFGLGRKIYYKVVPNE